MTLLQVWICLLSWTLWAPYTQAEQYVMQDEMPKSEQTQRAPMRIAIIGLSDPPQAKHERASVKPGLGLHGFRAGAGVAGASAAYYLHERTRLSNSVEITIFERSSRVGGRVKSAYVFDNPQDDIETGGATFSKADWCLNQAMEEVGLKAESTNSGMSKNLGVWDGEQFVYTERESSSHWWNIIKLVWQYGRWPLRMNRLVVKTVKSFHKLATVSYQPFKSLDEEAKRLGLKSALEDDAETYLKREVVTEYEGWKYMQEIIQANGRARYTQDLQNLHGLASIMSMSSEETQSVKGGNWRLIDRMIRISEATLHLNSQVTRINRNRDNSITLHYICTNPKSDWKKGSSTFDNIIIATPFHQSSIEITPPLENPPLDIPFVTRHVTHFTSDEKITNGQFNFNTNTTIPEDVLTTLSYPNNNHPNYFSLTLPQKIYYLDGCILSSTYLYKLVSPDPIPSSTIHLLLNKTQPPTTNNNVHNPPQWIHHETWPHAYPHFPPRTTFDNVELAPGIYYTGAGENLISSMEMSCLMGYNVAGIIYWLDYYSDEEVEIVP
ncbi:MAG: hypothetical protein M1812_007426 [Candelaria pacifica]|nr:MAG: hypothetical protein M1812_007426 [Candelaria pacifica]